MSAKNILVVDDVEAVRKMVCGMLRINGYNCLEAADGAEALRVLEDRLHQMHLVLTDVVMPNMGGAELARRVSRMRPDLRILFMSGYSEDPLVRSIERIPDIFLAKPFTAAALTEKVQQALEHPWTGLPEESPAAGPQ